jgi:hypothetical protein
MLDFEAIPMIFLIHYQDPYSNINDPYPNISDRHAVRWIHSYIGRRLVQSILPPSNTCHSRNYRID